MSRPRLKLAPIDPPPAESASGCFSAGSLTVKQALAEFGGVTRNRLFELMKQGEISWCRPPWSKGRLVCRASLREYLRKHRVGVRP